MASPPHPETHGLRRNRVLEGQRNKNYWGGVAFADPRADCIGMWPVQSHGVPQSEPSAKKGSHS